LDLGVVGVLKRWTWAGLFANTPVRLAGRGLPGSARVVQFHALFAGGVAGVARLVRASDGAGIGVSSEAGVMVVSYDCTVWWRE
jgi:hypothetical protein